MGMRSVIAVRTDESHMHVTRVQWASYLPANMALAITTLMEGFDASYSHVLRTLGTAIASVDHLGAVEVVFDKDLKEKDESSYNPYSRTESRIIQPRGDYGNPSDAVVLCGANMSCAFNLPEILDVSNHDEAWEIVRTHDHAQDGISALIDLVEETVTFWLDPQYASVATSSGFAYNVETGEFPQISESNCREFYIPGKPCLLDGEADAA